MRSGSGVATKPSAVVVTRFARRAARIVPCRAARASSRKAGGTYIGVAPGLAWTLPRGWSTRNVQFPAATLDQFADMAPETPATARITQRICDAIKGQIASGRLSAGARLPSTRALAAEWGVSRTTVTAAYEQLIAEGYLEARQGARTQVAPGLALAPAPPGQTGASERPDRLSAYGQRLAEFELPSVSD